VPPGSARGSGWGRGLGRPGIACAMVPIVSLQAMRVRGTTCAPPPAPPDHAGVARAWTFGHGGPGVWPIVVSLRIAGRAGKRGAPRAGSGVGPQGARSAGSPSLQDRPAGTAVWGDACPLPRHGQATRAKGSQRHDTPGHSPCQFRGQRPAATQKALIFQRFFGTTCARRMRF